MAISIPSSQQSGRIGQAQKGVDIRGGGELVGQGLTKVGETLHGLGTEILKKRKAVQASNFANKGVQDYLIEKEETKQALETKYKGTSAEGYHKEFKEWNDEQLDNIRGNSPTDDALNQFNNAVASKENETLVNSNARELEMFVDYQVKDFSAQNKILSNNIVGMQGRGLQQAEDYWTLQQDKLNTLEGQTGMDTATRTKMEDEAGNEMAMSFGNAAVRKMHVAELGRVLGPTVLNDPRIQTLIDTLPEEEQALAAKTLKKLKKGADAGESTLSPYLKPKQREKLIRDLLAKATSKSDDSVADYNIQHGDMKTTLQKKGGRLNENEKGALSGLLQKLTVLDKSAIYKKDKMGELANSYAEGVIASFLGGISEVDGEDAIKFRDNLLNRTIEEMSSDVPELADALADDTFNAEFKEQMTAKLEGIHSKMWSDIKSNPAQGLYEHNPQVNSAWDAWSDAVASDNSPEVTSKLFNTALNLSQRLGVKMGLKVDDLGTGVPPHIGRYFVGNINALIDQTYATDADRDAANSKVLGIIRKLQDSTQKMTTDENGNEKFTGGLSEFWDEMADADPDDSFTREMRFVSQMPEPDIAAVNLKKDTLTLLSKDNIKTQNQTLHRVSNGKVKPNMFANKVTNHPAFQEVSLSYTTGDGLRNGEFVNSLNNIITRALIKNSLADPRSQIAGVEKGSENVTIDDLVTDDIIERTIKNYVGKQYVSITDAGGTTLVTAPTFVVNEAVERHMPKGNYTKQHHQEYTRIAGNQYKVNLLKNRDNILLPPKLEADIVALGNQEPLDLHYTPEERKALPTMGPGGKKALDVKVRERVRVLMRERSIDDYVNGASLVTEKGSGVKLVRNGNPLFFKDATPIKQKWSGFYGDPETVETAKVTFKEYDRVQKRGAWQAIKDTLSPDTDEVNRVEAANKEATRVKKRAIEANKDKSKAAKKRNEKAATKLVDQIKGGWITDPEFESGLEP